MARIMWIDVILVAIAAVIGFSALGAYLAWSYATAGDRIDISQLVRLVDRPPMFERAKNDARSSLVWA